VLHALIQINAVVELAAALTDEGQPHAVEKAQAAAKIAGSFRSGQVATERDSGFRNCRVVPGSTASRRREIKA